MLSKNTLTKRFLVQEIQSFPIKILENPLVKIHEFLSNKSQQNQLPIIDTVFLPLYGKNKQDSKW